MATSDYPAKLPLKCATNQTFDKTITWLVNGSPVNLTGATAAMQLKWDGSNEAKVTLTQASGLTLGGVAGTIRIVISAATMAGLVPGLYDYDLVVTIGTAKTPLIKDTFTVTQGVTL